MVTFDVSSTFESISKYSNLTKKLSTCKVFTDETSLGLLGYMVEVVKKAWYFGQVSNFEFDKFVSVIKHIHYLRIFPYILACFRLLNIERNEEISLEGYNPLVELCTVALNQSSQQCDIFVPSEMLTLAETYYVVPNPQVRIYILDKLKTNKIFSQKEFWECYLIWMVNKNSKGIEHFYRKSVNMTTLKQIAQDCVGSVVRSAILTMSRAGLDKSVANEIITSMIDKFKLDEQNKGFAFAFLKEYQAEKSDISKEVKSKFDIEESLIN